MSKGTAGQIEAKLASIMVDAAIVIPLFIISLGMMLQVINIIAIEEASYYKALCNIQTVGALGSDLELGISVNDAGSRVSISNVLRYPITYKINFPFNTVLFKSKVAIMDMPYKTYIGESPQLYDNNNVYIFPKNEGNEKEGPRYHDKFCRTMKAGATKGLEITKTEINEAKARGYTQCQWCQKLKYSDEHN